MYNLYTVAKDWKLTPEQQAALDQWAGWLGANNPADSITGALAELQGWLAALSAPAVAAMAALKANLPELQEYSGPEIRHALRITYGAKPDPTRRRELLYDENGKLPDTVTIKKAAKYASVTERRIEQLVADGKLRAVGGKGHRRVFTSDLISYYPLEK